MSSTYRLVAGFLVCALVTGCGDSKKGPAAGGGDASAAGVTPASAMLELVPAGAVGVVYIPSLKGLEEHLQRLAKTVDETEAPPKIADLAQFLQGFDSADLDMAQPAAIVLTLASDTEPPGFTAIVPVRDDKTIAAKVKAKNPSAVVDAAGGFAAITTMGAYKRGGMPARLAGSLPRGDLVVRLDIATLAKTFGPMLFAQAEEQIEALGSMSGAGENAPNPAASLKPMMNGLRSAVEASSVWDFAVRIDGTSVETELEMVFPDRAKAPLLDLFAKADLAVLARAVPDDGMMSIALAIDQARIWPQLSAFVKSTLEIYPPEHRALLQKTFDATGQVTKTMGPGMAMSASFTAQGMEVAGSIQTPDPAAYIRSITEMTASLDLKDSFMKVSPPEERTVDGTKVTSFRMQVIADKVPEPMKGAGATPEMIAALYGKDGSQYNVAGFGNRVVLAIGGDDVLKRALKAAKAGEAGPLSKALAAAGPDAVGFVRMDMRALMRGVSGIMSAAAQKDVPKLEVGPGDPVLITAIANAGPDRFRARLSIDVGKFAAMIKEMMPK